jgi:2,3-bisphosphoglycerate-independent phosphoglycerate mutase
LKIKFYKRNYMSKKAMLVILDGWGHNSDPKVSALTAAHTPFIDSLYKTYPHAELVTFGTEVGLPEGQMGNSEVGHLNIGAGRVVYQELARINKAVAEGTLAQHPVVQATIDKAKAEGKPIHLMGLVSDGGVHSHISHIIALANLFTSLGIQVHLHAFMDGRDTGPQNGKGYLETLLSGVDLSLCSLETVIGRYYAMDRDNRWERIAKAYDLLTKGVGEVTDDVLSAVQSCYDKGITDEFMEPLKVGGAESGLIGDGAIVCFANFRTDRPRQLTRVLTQEAIEGMAPLDLHFVTMTRYDDTFKNISVIYEKEEIKKGLGEVVSTAGLKQLRIAETEKYPHVTFFFSGGQETPLPGEERIVVNSPKVATYDLQPEMSAYKVTSEVVAHIQESDSDLVILNYANADMVGHTGIFDAAVQAAEVLDACVEVLIGTALQHEYQILIIADHGNSDIMVNGDGSPHTAHTTNMVPAILVQNKVVAQLSDGKLADIAPTLLALMGLEQPQEMTGKSLLM